MNAKQVAKEIQNFEDARNQRFTATLKNGDTVECVCNPKMTELEAAYQQTTSAETFDKGDVIRASEIQSID